MTTQPTPSPHQHEPYEPEGIKFFSKSLGKEMILCTDETRPENGWICYKHPDGQWVTLRIASQADREELARAREKQLTEHFCELLDTQQTKSSLLTESNEDLARQIEEITSNHTAALSILESRAETIDSMQDNIDDLAAQVVKLTERAEKADKAFGNLSNPAEQRMKVAADMVQQGVDREHDLRELATRLVFFAQCYADKNPIWHNSEGTKQDPCGVHRALADARKANLLK